MPCCVVAGCPRQGASTRVSFFNLPTNPETRRQWLEAIRVREAVLPKTGKTCTLECEGNVDTRKLDLCRDILTEEDRVAIDNIKQQVESTEHLLAKKYGGFMKRYGGFMIKKAAELDGGGLPADGDGGEVVSKRYGGFMKKDAAEDKQLEVLREILSVGLSAEAGEQRGDGDEVSKRYGGFMRSVRGSGGGLEEAGRELHKRYGGFMRRVGRPEWLTDQKSYRGILKRSWEEVGETSLPDMQKRYGGFMD